MKLPMSSFFARNIDIFAMRECKEGVVRSWVLNGPRDDVEVEGLYKASSFREYCLIT